MIIDNVFKTGKYYNQPVDSIKPDQKQTVYVMNTEGFHLSGVSGGVSIAVKSKVTTNSYVFFEVRSFSKNVFLVIFLKKCELF